MTRALSVLARVPPPTFLSIYWRNTKPTLLALLPAQKLSADRLKAHGIPVYDLNAVDEVTIYVDGADESNPHLELIKGGGAALTRENYRRCGQRIPLYCRWLQVGRSLRYLPTTSGSYPDGTKPCST